MVYGHTVKHNGVIYLAGAEVPVEVEEKKEESVAGAQGETGEEKKKPGRPKKE